MHHFGLYGLAVRSAVPFRHAPPAVFDPCTAITLRICPLANVVDGVRSWRSLPGAAWGRTAEGDYVLRWDALLAARIDPSARSIAVAALAPDGLDVLSGYLYPQLLSFPLVASGHEPWHSTAVAMDGGAVGILGSPGAGKSTLAAALLGAGGTLVTDDVLVVKEEGALPGPARLKLTAAAARRFLGLAADVGEPLRANAPKLAFPVPVVAGAVPLRALVALDGPPYAPPIRLRGAAAIRALLTATFNRVVDEPARLRRQLEAAATLAATVPVWRMGRAEGWNALALAAQKLPEALSL